ncbi:oligogalacturonate lyase family protein [Coraliomargarita sp. SDUM461004]|uniref:Oligogalacturonate lyase family protein n=1 Tax=Thalassobacterium sedimentorum TaxID=3041258 RepID=A0ABU1AP92_9BACT|nr:oligogalacturonate lyase family protein [Coraliomargarita sp. SDUM461004]MDQ8195576.1 oligogalacturonate lyase family protein [Coraliomargarita sp. SDUM461004]
MMEHLSTTPTLISDWQQNRYLTYPHCNGFSRDGESILLGQLRANCAGIYRRHLVSGDIQLLAEFDCPAIGWIAFDVALAADVVAVIVDQKLWILDVYGSHQPRCIYEFDIAPLATWDFLEKGLQPIPSISKDGQKVIVGVTLEWGTRVLCIDVTTGSVEQYIEKPFWLTHAHFCPHQESWIGFCHEGAAESIHDRVWGWHESLAPEGRVLFNQKAKQNGESLCVGHERWCFHEATALVVAYGRGISPFGPCGLYRVGPDAKGQGELIRESDRYWHCNISRDGRWAVVDTTGPYDADGTGWDNSEKVSDVLAIDIDTGAERWLARSRRSRQQTSHPHPTFSPDGSTVFYNQASDCGRYCRVLSVPLKL